MKINREARMNAKKLFNTCKVNGRLDEDRVRATVERWLEGKPRNYLSTLKWFHKLVSIEMAKYTATIESAGSMESFQQDLETALQKRFGDGLHFQYQVNPGLIGGVRIQVGSDVWDGSIKGRLEAVANSI